MGGNLSQMALLHQLEWKERPLAMQGASELAQSQGRGAASTNVSKKSPGNSFNKKKSRPAGKVSRISLRNVDEKGLKRGKGEGMGYRCLGKEESWHF